MQPQPLLLLLLRPVLVKLMPMLMPMFPLLPLTLLLLLGSSEAAAEEADAADTRPCPSFSITLHAALGDLEKSVSLCL